MPLAAPRPASGAPPSAAAQANGVSQVQPAALPALRGRDRDEPGGPQGGLGAVPALRGVAQVGLPGLQAHALGRRAALRHAGFAWRCASRSCAISRRLSRRSATSIWTRRSSICERVLEFAPDLPGLGNGIAKIRQRQADIAPRPAGLRDRAGRRPARAARAAVEAWSRLVDPASPELQAAWSELARDLRRAEALAARARNLERSEPAAARDLYRQSLAIAADLPEALAGLERTPPDPPTALDAQVLGDRIRLSGRPRRPMAWARSHSSSSASAAASPAPRRRHPDRRGRAPASSTTCT